MDEDKKMYIAWGMILWFTMIILFASCKTKKVAMDESMDIAAVEETLAVDSSVFSDNILKTHYEIERDGSVIEEKIIEIEYDTNTGFIAKETKTERSIRQDINKAVSEEKHEGLNAKKLSVYSLETDVNLKDDVSVDREDVGSAESFGKWIAIGVVCLIFVILLWYRLKKTTFTM